MVAKEGREQSLFLSSLVTHTQKFRHLFVVLLLRHLPQIFNHSSWSLPNLYLMRFIQLLKSAFYCYLYFTSGFILCVMETSHLQEMHMHAHFYPVFDEQHSVISTKKNTIPSAPPPPLPPALLVSCHIFLAKEVKKIFWTTKWSFSICLFFCLCICSEFSLELLAEIFCFFVWS